MISSQQFEKPDQAAAYSKFRLEPPQELLDIIISYLSEEIPMPFGQAVDVGCGTGQSTVVLAPYFRSVIGCDVSNSQIREATLARKVSNVEYRIAPAESLPVADKSVHLLTAATCFHWLDTQAFFRETDRVLAPGGVLAIYSSAAMYSITGDDETDIQLKFLTDKNWLSVLQRNASGFEDGFLCLLSLKMILYDDLKPYRCSRVQQLLEQYKNIEFPFDDTVRVQNIAQTNMASVVNAAGYIKSMSTFQNFKAVNPLKADKLLQDYEDSIMDILKANTTPDRTPLLYKRDFFLIMCRKDKMTNNIYKN